MSKHTTIKKIFALFILFINVNIVIAGDASLLPPPQVAVSPSVIEVTLGKKPNNEVIHVYNLSDKEMTVHTSVSHWDTNDNNQVRVIPPTVQSLDQWIIINPLTFTIPAGKSQVVRLSIRPQTIPSEGEHRGMVFFENKKQPNPTSKGVSALFRIGVGIYGLAGNIIRQGSLESLTLNQESSVPALAFTIKSTGNANIRLAGQYSIWQKTDFPTNATPVFDLSSKTNSFPDNVLHAATLPTTPVLAGTTRILLVPITLPKQAGEYTVFVNGILGENIIRQVFNITLP